MPNNVDPSLKLVGYRIIHNPTGKTLKLTKFSSVNGGSWVTRGWEWEFTCPVPFGSEIVDDASKTIPGWLHNTRGDAMRAFASYIDDTPAAFVTDFRIDAVYQREKPEDIVTKHVADVIFQQCMKHELPVQLKEAEITALTAELLQRVMGSKKLRFHSQHARLELSVRAFCACECATRCNANPWACGVLL